MLLRTFPTRFAVGSLVLAGSALLLVVLIKVGADSLQRERVTRTAVSVENTEQFCERINEFLHSEKR